MMTVHFTCPECKSGVHVYPDKKVQQAQCDVCQHTFRVRFTEEHEQSLVKECPFCERKDFYSQKDFNRKLGVLFFVIAAILSIWTYGLSLVALYLIDVFLFRQIATIVICYKCHTIFRKAANRLSIPGFNHEMNDRIEYADHDFQGQQIEH